MARIVAIGTMLVFLALLFYLPSAYDGVAFIERIRVEYDESVEHWGEQHALVALSAASGLQETERKAPAPNAHLSPVPRVGIDNAAAQRLAQASERLVNNQYVRSINALLALFVYRLVATLSLFPLGVLILFASLGDGMAVRKIRARELGLHDPEIFATFGAAAAFVVCGTAILFLLPIHIHPLLLLLPPIFAAVCLNQVVANYRARS
ncbi:MAG: DUF4400 domain-containing protein [Fimbriimonadaceae bacterium]|nr:DUF4400 domain-containing protein [Fimbriimonadaceae bacterium]